MIKRESESQVKYLSKPSNISLGNSKWLNESPCDVKAIRVNWKPELGKYSAQICFFLVVCFLLGNSLAPEFLCRRFEILCLFHLYRRIGVEFLHLSTYEDGPEDAPKRQYLNFRRRGITQKKAYNIQNTAKVWKEECFFLTQIFCDVLKFLQISTKMVRSVLKWATFTSLPTHLYVVILYHL
jgi:hypothetical protein